MPDIQADQLAESRAFYVGLFGFEVGMDLGWIVNLGAPGATPVRINLLSHDALVRHHSNLVSRRAVWVIPLAC